MLKKRGLCVVCSSLRILSRNLTSTEVSSALRPFYFSVHPDLFGQHPKERAINENSLQQLSSVLQNLQASKYLTPITLPFYVKNRNNQSESAKLIKIYLKEKDLGTTVISILKACDLPVKHLQHYGKSKENENIQNIYEDFIKVKYRNEYDFTKMNDNHPLYETYKMQQKINKVKENLRLTNWIALNYEDSLTKCKSNSATRDEIERLKTEMINEFKLKDIKWDCGWNSQHFRGCLLALKSLIEQHPQHMRQLENQILVFSYFTGISLDGHLMLFSGEVRHNWLDFIKNIGKHKAALGRVPFYEKSLSHVLRNIKVRRRKFMPDMKVSEYEANLKRLTTSISDYFGRNSYPKTWPLLLENFEIVVENEAGPMMVSPTGQFIVPSGIPGPLLVSFITTNLDEATKSADIYKKDKVLEKSLHQQCINDLNLAALIKEDNITPELMIQFCQNILKNKEKIRPFINGLHVNVSTYYSVLSDGVVCIPWNFNL